MFSLRAGQAGSIWKLTPWSSSPLKTDGSWQTNTPIPYLSILRYVPHIIFQRILSGNVPLFLTEVTLSLMSLHRHPLFLLPVYLTVYFLGMFQISFLQIPISGSDFR
jgi:hypothetical protein